MPSQQRKPIKNNTFTEEELLAMTYEEVTKDLPEKYLRFCEYYVEGHNFRQALFKAGYRKKINTSDARRLLSHKRLQIYIQWLKVRALKQCMVNAQDILDQWARIAFADITDFIDIQPNHINLKPNSHIDGQLVKSISSGKTGTSIELQDKMKALDNLAKYIADMPKDHKQSIEERKLELAEQEFQLKKKLIDLENPQQEDDGFIKAIKESAKAIWDNK